MWMALVDCGVAPVAAGGRKRLASPRWSTACAKIRGLHFRPIERYAVSTDEIQDAFVGRLQRTTNGVACALFAQQLGNTVNARVSHDPIDHYRYDYA